MADLPIEQSKGLIDSEGASKLRALTEALLSRQEADGERKGSFNRKPSAAYYWDYTAPLALMAAYKSSLTDEADKARYLKATKDWLAHAYSQQNEDGTMRPFDANAAAEPALEASAGTLWVASRYREAIKDRPDREALLNIVEGDKDALDALAARSVKALSTHQREDGLMAAATNYSVAYYTSSAYSHAALESVMSTYPAGSDIHDEAKAVHDKLGEGLKGFIDAKQKHVPFMKNVDFQQYPGHEIQPDAHAGMLHGDNKYTEALKGSFEKAMGAEKTRVDFFKVQTVPCCVPAGLHAAGYKEVTIDGKAVPMAKIMEQQIDVLLENDAREAKTGLLHKTAFACVVGYEGSSWVPRIELEPAKAVEKERPKDPMEDALKKAKEALPESNEQGILYRPDAVYAINLLPAKTGNVRDV